MTPNESRTKDFFLHFARAYPSRSAMMVTLLAVAGILEGLGVATMLPLLELVTGDTPGSDSRASELLQGAIQSIGLEPSLGVLLGIIVLTMSAKAVFLWVAMRQVGFTIAQVTTDLRMDLLRALMRARWRYYSSQSAGRFANALSNEAWRAASAYQEACIIIAGALQIIVYLVIALAVSWQLALATPLIGGVFFFLLRGFVRIARQAGQEQTELTRSLVIRLTDALTGIKPIRAMAREAHLQPLLEKETEALNQSLRKLTSAGEALRLFQEPTLVVLLALGLFFALGAGGQPFSSVLVLTFVFYRLMTHASQLHSRLLTIAPGEAAFWSLWEQIQSAEQEREVVGGSHPAPPLVDGIRFANVRFGYDDSPLLDGLSFHIPARKITALYGSSGAGKTTIADLLLGFHRPDAGTIEIDGVQLEDIDILGWRKCVGYVPQEMFLFHDTIFSNVALGDSSTTREAVVEALRAAGAWDFVEERVGGLDAVIGAGGAKLSGGQRQRIAIARALVHRPRLLIFDEATASLDPATEQEILDTLRVLSEDVTVLAISHQPALREVADVLYSLDRGRITEVRGVAQEP